MNIRSCKKITIVGTPGGGKTFLAKTLSEELKLPVFHMDVEFGSIVGKGTLAQRTPIILNRIKAETSGKKWIIDGNYPSHAAALRMRMEKADVVLYLNLPTEYVIENIKQCADIVDDDANGLDTKQAVDYLVAQVQRYEQKNEAVKSFVTTYAKDKYIEFTTRAEVNDFIASLKPDVKKK